MAKGSLRIISVGALKTSHWKEAAKHYMERIKHWRQVEACVVKDGDAALPVPKRNAHEGQKILNAITPQDYVICLDERGKTYKSKDFALFLQKIYTESARTPCFIIGGAFGLADEVKKASHHLLALGQMTLPHELAHVVLLEQIYRAEAILRNIPYHHD